MWSLSQCYLVGLSLLPVSPFSKVEQTRLVFTQFNNRDTHACRHVILYNICSITCSSSRRGVRRVATLFFVFRYALNRGQQAREQEIYRMLDNMRTR